MSAGGSAMLRGGLLSSNKGAPTMEEEFTERNDRTDSPRNFDEAYNNVSVTIEMIDKGELREDVLSTIEWLSLLIFKTTMTALSQIIR